MAAVSARRSLPIRGLRMDGRDQVHLRAGAKRIFMVSCLKVAEMKQERWIYAVERGATESLERFEAMLDDHGKGGWELVYWSGNGASAYIAVFKRRIIEQESPGWFSGLSQWFRFELRDWNKERRS